MRPKRLRGRAKLLGKRTHLGKKMNNDIGKTPKPFNIIPQGLEVHRLFQGVGHTHLDKENDIFT